MGHSLIEVERFPEIGETMPLETIAGHDFFTVIELKDEPLLSRYFESEVKTVLFSHEIPDMNKYMQHGIPHAAIRQYILEKTPN